jgi:hypothetical protein
VSFHCRGSDKQHSPETRERQKSFNNVLVSTREIALERRKPGEAKQAVHDQSQDGVTCHARYCSACIVRRDDLSVDTAHLMLLATMELALLSLLHLRMALNSCDSIRPSKLSGRESGLCAFRLPRH